MFKLVKEIRNKKGDLHFKRWQIWSTKWFNIYLHFINKADEDKHMHTHPWNFWSIILKGGYIEFSGVIGESLMSKVTKRGFLHMAYRKYNVPHMVGFLTHPTYTLVITGPGGKEWGYETESGWKDHETYRKEKHSLY